MAKMRLRRRVVVQALGGLCLWPALGAAQSSAKVPTIGIIGAGSEASHGPWVAAMVARLRELGWRDGDNIRIAYRWAEGQNDRAAAYAKEFAEAKVDLIVSSGTAVVAAVKAAPDTVVVAASMSDPVKQGLAQSLAHPGGLVTGSSILTGDLAPKRIQLLREIFPALRRLAVMGYAVPYAGEMEQAQAYAKAQGLDVTPLPLKTSADIAVAFDSIKSRTDALYVAITPFTSVNRAEIFRRALDERLPSVTGLKEYVAAGALISYGTDFEDVFRRAGDTVDRILRGQKPGDIPFEQVVKFDLAVNLKTAKSLGLDTPPSILAAADEVIE
jgi:putative tryptophan/tyrosine transport system substrate-binding protein